MLSKDLDTIDPVGTQAWAILLTEICCGRSHELWDTWRQGRALPANTVFSPAPLVDEIASIVLLQSWRSWSTWYLLNTVFRTGDINAGNEILSMLISRSPDFAASLGDIFSWREAMINPPVDFLGKNSDSTQGLLVRCGADQSCILYYRMASVPEIAYWKEVLEKGVDDKLLNSLLLFSAAYRPVEFTEYLLSRGAAINYRSGFSCDRGRTALEYAALWNDMEVAIFLLDRGADILQEFVGPGRKNSTFSRLVARHYPDRAWVFAQIECEERLKRGKAHGLFLLHFCLPVRLEGVG